MASNICSRRSFVGALAAAAGLVAAGCKPSATKQAQETQKAPGEAPAAGLGPSPTAAAMTVFRDPGCGCCEQWAALARQAGYPVTLVDRTDMPAIKQKYGVPERLATCHTAVVGDYVVEGHVPFADVRRLLEKRPADVKGIAVAGMPIGSPGMDMTGAAKEPFEVMAFDAEGKIRPFRA